MSQTIMSKQALKIMLNGKCLSDISIMDRGFQYGDGLFETMLVRGKKIPLWDNHYSRLKKGCLRLLIAVPDKTDLLYDINKLIENNNKTEKYIVKLIVTRGITGRGYAISENVVPQIVLILTDFPDYPQAHWQAGVTTRICDIKLSQQPLLAGIKHLNRLEQVLARNEWTDDNIIEGFVCDQNDNVIEAIMSNVFVVKNSKVFTPKLEHCGVEGVMRNQVLQYLNKENINNEIVEINQQQLFSADEVFLTNSIIGIWPVRKIADRLYKVGPVTQLLQNKLAADNLSEIQSG